MYFSFKTCISAFLAAVSFQHKNDRNALCSVSWVAIFSFCYKESSIVIIGYVTFCLPWLSFIPHCSRRSALRVIQSFKQKIRKVLESETTVYFSFAICKISHSWIHFFPVSSWWWTKPCGRDEIMRPFPPQFMNGSLTRHDDTWILCFCFTACSGITKYRLYRQQLDPFLTTFLIDKIK